MEKCIDKLFHTLTGLLSTGQKREIVSSTVQDESSGLAFIQKYAFSVMKQEEDQKVELILCICCQKVYAESPIHDFGEAVEWNVGDRGENCLSHQTEKLIIDYSHFSSDGEAEKVYMTKIFLATGQKLGQIFLIKRNRTRLDAPAVYEIIAKGEEAVNGYNAAVLKLRQNSSTHLTVR